MVKSTIIPVGPSTPVTLVTWKSVQTTRGTKEKMVKVTPRKKAQYAIPKNNVTPTRAGSASMEQSGLFPDDDGYPYMDDEPSTRRFQMPKNQV